MSERPGFIMYSRHRTLFEHLAPKERGELITAIFKYFCDGEITEFKNKATSMAYDIITEQISFDASEYKKKCQKNAENIRKRWAGRNTDDNTVVNGCSDSYTKEYHTEAESADKSEQGSYQGSGAGANQSARGTYRNVYLSEVEYRELCEEFPKDIESRIERLSEYMKDTGQTYKSHAGAIRRWARNEKKQARVGTSNSDFDENKYFEAALLRSKRYLERLKSEENEKDESRTALT